MKNARLYKGRREKEKAGNWSEVMHLLFSDFVLQPICVIEIFSYSNIKLLEHFVFPQMNSLTGVSIFGCVT